MVSYKKIKNKKNGIFLSAHAPTPNMTRTKHISDYRLNIKFPPTTKNLRKITIDTSYPSAKKYNLFMYLKAIIRQQQDAVTSEQKYAILFWSLHRSLLQQGYGSSIHKFSLQEILVTHLPIWLIFFIFFVSTIEKKVNLLKGTSSI